MIRKVLLSLFISCTGLAHAQTGKLFDADKQLSSSFTSQVYLDRDGFIWVATRNGINWYDGYQFHSIVKEKQPDMSMMNQQESSTGNTGSDSGGRATSSRCLVSVSSWRS